jgi:hypothetical protein
MQLLRLMPRSNHHLRKWREKLQENSGRNSRKNGAKIQNLDIKDDIFTLFTVGRDSGGLTGE